MLQVPMPTFSAALDAQTVKERHVLILQRGMNLFKIYNRRVHRIKRPISG